MASTVKATNCEPSQGTGLALRRSLSGWLPVHLECQPLNSGCLAPLRATYSMPPELAWMIDWGVTQGAQHPNALFQTLQACPCLQQVKMSHAVHDYCCCVAQ
eukprot:scaffold229189_cov18-Tisochrysis_lutea.AAC.1